MFSGFCLFGGFVVLVWGCVGVGCLLLWHCCLCCVVVGFCVGVGVFCFFFF